jgi:hypothetical protein
VGGNTTSQEGTKHPDSVGGADRRPGEGEKGRRVEAAEVKEGAGGCRCGQGY